MNDRAMRWRAIRLFGAGRGSCGKIRFLVPWKAAAYREALVAAGTRDPAADGRLAEYRCPRCKAWHVGHRAEA